MSEKMFKKLRAVHKRIGIPLAFLKKQYKNMNWRQRTDVMREDRSEK